MSLIEIITEQLNSYPKFKKQARISYYAAKPLEQIHVDTGFFQPSGVLDAKKLPFLVCCDVATRFTMYFPQERKNQLITEFIGLFIDAVKEKWPEEYSKDCLMIIDGARELKIEREINGVYVHSKVSKGIGKAVLAEVSIRKMRAIFRQYETALNLHNMNQGTDWKIDESNISDLLSFVQEIVNQKAKIRKMKKPVPFQPSEFTLGTPVFAINLHKFFPHAMKSQMTKDSYKLNYYWEPFYISKIHLYQGIYKYNLSTYTDNQELKYAFYSDQLQRINKEHASQYIKDWVRFGSKTAEAEEDQ